MIKLNHFLIKLMKLCLSLTVLLSTSCTTKHSTYTNQLIQIPQQWKSPKYLKLKTGFYDCDKVDSQCVLNEDIAVILKNNAICENSRQNLVAIMETMIEVPQPKCKWWQFKCKKKESK